MVESSHYASSSLSARVIECESCYETLDLEHTGLKCPQGHDICKNCTKLYLELVFQDPSTNIPPKCISCTAEIPVGIFEMQLDQNQLASYQLTMCTKTIGPDEVMKCCPRCPYCEVWQSSSTSNFFFCKKPECKRVSCAYCNLEVKMPNDETARLIIELERDIRNSQFYINELKFSYDYIHEKEEKYNQELEVDQGVLQHLNCAMFSSSKEAILNAIEKGEKVPCPTCGLAGRKDDNCTHMKCPGCSDMWCYICGRRFEMLFISEHNQSWQRDEDKCPMYFVNIKEIDNRWPENDLGCLNRFHRYRTLKELEKTIETIGIDCYKKAFEQFGCIKNCGYKLEDLDDPLIKEPLIIRDIDRSANHIENNSLAESAEQIRENEAMSDNDDPDVILRFDRDVLRILYSEEELNEENRSRRGRRNRRRGRGNRGRVGENESRNELSDELSDESQIISVDLYMIIPANNLEIMPVNESEEGQREFRGIEQPNVGELENSGLRVATFLEDQRRRARGRGRRGRGRRGRRARGRQGNVDS